MESDADYVLALKGKKGIAHEEIRSFFDDIVPTDPSMKNPPSLDQAESLETVAVDHGSIETRRYWISNDLDWFEDNKKWEGLQSIGMVESVLEIGNERSYERRYFLASTSYRLNLRI